MFSEFQGRVAVVTGAASNIGKAIAVEMARSGAHVVLVDVNQDGLDAIAADITALDGATYTSRICDLATTDGWQDLLKTTRDLDVDYFVHSASPRRFEHDTVATVTEDTFDAMLNVNVRSGFFLARAYGLEMQARVGKGAEPGSMLFITSLHAETPRNLPHYAASKGAQAMLVRELSRFFAPSGIRVNALAPGAIQGGGFKLAGGFDALAARIPMKRMGAASDITAPALALLSNAAMGYVTGATLAVDGGLKHYNWIEMAHSGEGQD